ncbi:MAG: twin-arginine translocation signal domain-containing protein [Alphaproteobacteria bacterium]|nr:MAG: twin-arginine translocation signal domain-containing protein [Alphaproteobacteria bacterium]
MKRGLGLSRRKFLTASAITAAAAAAGGRAFEVPSLVSPAAAATDDPVGDPIHIGFLAALSGPDAGWGLPGLTGNQIFIDRVNAQGGLKVGKERRPLKMFAFDDEATGSKALQGAKQLVLENEVKFISAIGGNPADATHPFLTKMKVIYASLISTDIKPDRPYLIAGGDVTPRIDMLRPFYHRFVDSNLKRWAVISQDDTIGLTSQAWEVGSALADGWDVVYDEHYALETTDFAPVVTAMLATNPDVVSLNLSYPTFVVQIIEQLYLQGFKGRISANYLDTESILQKVPPEYIEGAVDSFPLFDDPWWGSPSWQHDFIKEWMSRYGPGAPEDVHREITGIDWDHVITLKVWAEGVTLAGTVEPDAVLEALRAQESFDTILGPAKMRGKDMWGIDNMISPPIPINEVRGGIKRVQAQVRFEDWFEHRKDKIISVVRDKGQMWDQR